MTWILANKALTGFFIIAGLALIIIGLLSVKIYFLSSDLDKAKQQHEVDIGAIAVLQSANVNLVESIKKQNKAVIDLKADEAKREKIAQEAVKAARTDAEAHYRAAQAISEMQTAPDACHGADQLMGDYIRRKM